MSEPLPPPADPIVAPPADNDVSIMVSMLADNKSTEEICHVLGWPESRVVPLAQSPWVMAQVRSARYRAKVADQTPEQLLEGETSNNVLKMIELRDQSEDLKVSFGATKEMLDRELPKITKIEEERTVKITLERKDFEAAQVIEAEVAQIADADSV